MINLILKEMRIDHYIKNLVILIPYILYKQEYTYANLIHLFFCFISFCFISSSIYIVNDLKDKEKDCLHPYKKTRPIASNLISPRIAIFLIIVLFVISLAISCYLGFYMFVLGYFVLNIAYSFYLKRFFFIDAVCIASGFIFRLLSSFYILNTPVYFPVVIWLFFLSIFFTFIKRMLEFNTMKDTKYCYRKGLAKANITTIKNIILISAIISTIFFIATAFKYTIFIKLYYIVLFYVLSVWRILFLAYKSNDFNDPINFIKKDNLLKILLLLIFSFVLI